MGTTTIGSVFLSTKQFDHEAISINSEKMIPSPRKMKCLGDSRLSITLFLTKKALGPTQCRGISLRNAAAESGVPADVALLDAEWRF